MSNTPSPLFSKRGIRQNRILELLDTNSAMSTYDLCNALQCSEATIRNDLRELDKAGLIARTHGGATRLSDAKTSTLLDSFPVNSRLNSKSAEKQAIARYLMESGMIKRNQAIFIDFGSTCYFAAQAVSKCSFPLNVATNSLNIANLMVPNPNIQLTLGGGLYSPEIDVFDATGSLNIFSNMFFDYYFMGINGISRSNGCTCTQQDSANRMPVKRLLVSHSQKTVVLCDHSKINKTFMHGICKLSEISLIVTDDACSPEERQSFLELGAPVAFAPME
ncbi:MAG: DeoR/GlpR family DNA-binding transcription regulator [Candidatus Limiplasma sp.]|nr:DeoR/GlpR family DNA-binding transcription regulator [Candidatus Limiplasma sp.]